MRNNLAVGKRMREFWKKEILLAPGSDYRKGGR